MDAKKIGEKIRKLREDQGQTKAFLSRKFGVSYSTVCSWEYGERIPNDVCKKKIADHFGVPVTFFFEDK